MDVFPLLFCSSFIDGDINVKKKRRRKRKRKGRGRTKRRGRRGRGGRRGDTFVWLLGLKDLGGRQDFAPQLVHRGHGIYD